MGDRNEAKAGSRIDGSRPATAMRLSGKERNMPVGYAFQTLKFPDLAQLARPGAKVRGPLTYIRFREGQFNVASPPTKLNDYEAAPPQVRGAQNVHQTFNHRAAEQRPRAPAEQLLPPGCRICGRSTAFRFDQFPTFPHVDLPNRSVAGLFGARSYLQINSFCRCAQCVFAAYQRLIATLHSDEI